MSPVVGSMPRSSRISVRAATIWAVIFAVGLALLGLGAASAGTCQVGSPCSGGGTTFPPSAVAYFVATDDAQGNPNEVSLVDHSYVSINGTEVHAYIVNITVDWNFNDGANNFSYLTPGEYVHHIYSGPGAWLASDYIIKEKVTAVIPWDGGFVTSTGSMVDY